MPTAGLSLVMVGGGVYMAYKMAPPREDSALVIKGDSHTGSHSHTEWCPDFQILTSSQWIPFPVHPAVPGWKPGGGTLSPSRGEPPRAAGGKLLQWYFKSSVHRTCACLNNDGLLFRYVNLYRGSKQGCLLFPLLLELTLKTTGYLLLDLMIPLQELEQEYKCLLYADNGKKGAML